MIRCSEGGQKMQNSFIFELNETVYFRKNQQVLEMIGISLEPDISIQSFDEDIAIQGSIQLQGDYVKQDISENESSIDVTEDYSRRYIDTVMDIDESLAHFSHQFPVEISIPKKRVPDLDQLLVEIESFDYTLNEENQLDIQSTIMIQGIQGEEEKEEQKEAVDRDTDVQENELEDESFEIVERPDDPEDEQETEETEEHLSEETANSIEKDKGKERWKYKETQSFEEFFEKSAKKNKEEKVQTNVQEMEQKEVQAETTNGSHEGISTKKTKDEKDELEQETKEHFLSKWFRGETEEEQYAQLRICIVQASDTLETIADRYGVSTLQLLKQNRLEDDHLSEGQILTIPPNRKVQ